MSFSSMNEMKIGERVFIPAYLPYLAEDAEFNPIEEYPGYWCTEDGRIISTFKVGKVLKMYPNSKGYLQVTLGHYGSNCRKYVHRLVAESFLYNPGNKPQVNHIDGDKLNNHFSNLEWVTNQENSDHRHARVRR